MMEKLVKRINPENETVVAFMEIFKSLSSFPDFAAAFPELSSFIDLDNKLKDSSLKLMESRKSAYDTSATKLTTTLLACLKKMPSVSLEANKLKEFQSFAKKIESEILKTSDLARKLLQAVEKDSEEFACSNDHCCSVLQDWAIFS